MGSFNFVPQSTNSETSMFTGLPNSPSNQYGGGYPTPGASIPMPGSNNTGSAGAVPQTTNPQNTSNPIGTNVPNPGPQLGTQWSQYIGSGQSEVPPVDAQLQATLMNYLQSQVGQGVTPYNLQALLPTGGQTGPGQVASPLDPVTQQLMDFFTNGSSSNPALQSLQSLATTGNPIDQTPAWQAMVNASQNQIDEGGANVREQLAFTGNLPGSAGAKGISDYYSNANLGLTSQLVSAQTQALQQAQQNKLGAAGLLENSEQSLGNTLYGYDQNAITQLMNEYFQTTPQNNPLNSEMFSGATTYAPTFGKASTGGVVGQLLSNAPSLIGDAASGIGAGLGAAGAAGGGAGVFGSILAGLAAL